MNALDEFASLRRWCAWREFPRGDKITKVPVSAGGAPWKADTPETWLTLQSALITNENLPFERSPAGNGPPLGGGIGIALGDLGDGRVLCGVDLDACIGGDGVSPWALDALNALGMDTCYAEISPSGTGIKSFCLMAAADVATIREIFGIGDGKWGRGWKMPVGVDGGKAAGIEIHLGNRYFATTGEAFFEADTPLGVLDAGVAAKLADAVKSVFGLGAMAKDRRTVDVNHLKDGVSWQEVTEDEAGEEVARIADLRPRLARLLLGDDSVLGPDKSRSGIAWRFAGELRDAGVSGEKVAALLLAHPFTRDWALSVDVRQIGRTAFGHDGWEPGTGLASAMGAIDPNVVGPAGGAAVPAASGATGATGASVTSTGVGATGGSVDAWKLKLQVIRGEWRINLHNAVVALTEADEWQGMFALDEFAGNIRVLKCPPGDMGAHMWRGPRFLEDGDCLTAARWMQSHGLQIGKDLAFDAIIEVAKAHAFNPLRDYLSGLAWDGERRLDGWLNAHLGVMDTAYTRAVASITLIGAVARVMNPGCKMDTVTILEGEQGIGKSTALRILFGDEYFTDHLPDLHQPRDAAMQLAGKWGVEIAEIDKIKGMEAARVKSFCSTPVDRYRKPYGKVNEDVPRRSVMIGTTNHIGGEYLSDETGNRRFCPVVCTVRRLDVKALEAVRDGIWAEAVARWKQGENWWLLGDVLAEQQDQTRGRFADDAWGDVIRAYLADKTEVTITDLLRVAVAKPVGNWTTGDRMRVGRIMRSMTDQWARRQIWIGKNDTAGGQREWRYQRVSAIVVPFPGINKSRSGDEP